MLGNIEISNKVDYSVTIDNGRYSFDDGTNTSTGSLKFIIGNTYIFDLSSVGILHPFYISTEQNNPTTNIHDSDEITINEDILTFTPTVQRTLYYNCSIHANMSYAITVLSSITNTINYMITIIMEDIILTMVRL